MDFYQRFCQYLSGSDRRCQCEQKGRITVNRCQCYASGETDDDPRLELPERATRAPRASAKSRSATTAPPAKRPRTLLKMNWTLIFQKYLILCGYVRVWGLVTCDDPSGMNRIYWKVIVAGINDQTLLKSQATMMQNPKNHHPVLILKRSLYLMVNHPSLTLTYFHPLVLQMILSRIEVSVGFLFLICKNVETRTVIVVDDVNLNLCLSHPSVLYCTHRQLPMHKKTIEHPSLPLICPSAQSIVMIMIWLLRLGLMVVLAFAACLGDMENVSVRLS